uniref:Uncharacterized protein n=1 Tax=Cacopsylla melanoneura TaxID=428564 RepID=A0A8D9AQL1_9HEMI
MLMKRHICTFFTFNYHNLIMFSFYAKNYSRYLPPESRKYGLKGNVIILSKQCGIQRNYCRLQDNLPNIHVYHTARVLIILIRYKGFFLNIYKYVVFSYK